MPSNYEDEEAARRAQDAEDAENEASRNRRAYETHTTPATAGRDGDAALAGTPLLGWFTGADAREGVESFLEKRTPVYPVKVSDGLPDIFPDYEDPEFK